MGSPRRTKMALIVPQSEFQHILRVLNTNIDGRHKVPFAITSIRGIGRRFANIICKKAEIDPNKRAGELGPDEIEKIVTIISRPLQFIPPWMVNRLRILRTVRPTTSVPTISTASFVTPSSASGRSRLIVVFVTGGVFVSVDRRHALLVVRVALLAWPGRRGSKPWAIL